jgi:hypothetical protein
VRAAKRADQVERGRDAASELRSFAASFQREDVAPAAWAVAGLILHKVATGAVQVKRGDEAAALLRAVVDVARMEGGEPTSASVVAHMSSEAMAARIAQLQRDVVEALPAARAVEDGAALEAVETGGGVPYPPSVGDGAASETGGSVAAKPGGEG